MNKKNLLLVGAAIGVTMLGAVSVTSAANSTKSSEQKNSSQIEQSQNNVMHEEMNAFQKKIHDAIVSNDYTAWSTLMLEHNQKMKEYADAQVTESNFQTLQQAKELHNQGKSVDAINLLQDSGVHMPGMMSKGGMHGPKGKHGGMQGDSSRKNQQSQKSNQ